MLNGPWQRESYNCALVWLRLKTLAYQTGKTVSGLTQEFIEMLLASLRLTRNGTESPVKLKVLATYLLDGKMFLWKNKRTPLHRLWMQPSR